MPSSCAPRLPRRPPRPRAATDAPGRRSAARSRRGAPAPALQGVVAAHVASGRGHAAAAFGLRSATTGAAQQPMPHGSGRAARSGSASRRASHHRHQDRRQPATLPQHADDGEPADGADRIGPARCSRSRRSTASSARTTGVDEMTAPIVVVTAVIRVPAGEHGAGTSTPLRLRQRATAQPMRGAGRAKRPGPANTRSRANQERTARPPRTRRGAGRACSPRTARRSATTRAAGWPSTAAWPTGSGPRRSARDVQTTSRRRWRRRG